MKTAQKVFRLNHLLADSNNRILIGTDGKGLKYYDREQHQVRDYPSYSTLMDLTRTKVHCLMKTKTAIFGWVFF